MLFKWGIRCWLWVIVGLWFDVDHKSIPHEPDCLMPVLTGSLSLLKCFSWFILGQMFVINRLMTSQSGSSNDKYSAPISPQRNRLPGGGSSFLMSVNRKKCNTFNKCRKNLWHCFGEMNTRRLRHHVDILDIGGFHWNMWLETMAYLQAIVFLKTRQNKIDFLLCVCLCVCVCVCLSGPRPVASQMDVCEEDYYCKPALPTHTVSKTYIHKTHFSRFPAPILVSVQAPIWFRT